MNDAQKPGGVGVGCNALFDGWLPINTGPEDGTDVWLYCPDDEPDQLVGYYCVLEQLDVGFWQAREQLVADVAEIKPTHWRPKPPPPNALLQPDDRREAGGSAASRC